MAATIRRHLMIGIVLIVTLACNLSVPALTPDPAVAQTAAALTVAALVNQALSPTLPPAPPPSPSLTPIPSLTPLPSFTPLPSLTPPPTLTFTPTIPLISVSVDTNCRVGPGKIYDRVGALLVGQAAEVIARDPTGDYWYIRNPGQSSGFCWVWGEYATLSGNTTFLPVYTPPPSPTPAPDFALSYAGVDSCAGWWVELRVKNTGPIGFKSYTLTVKDIDTGTVLSDYGNGFIDTDGCLLSSAIAILEPGESYRISAPPFAYNPNGHRIRARVTLCTEKDQAGQCINQVIDFKP